MWNTQHLETFDKYRLRSRLMEWRFELVVIGDYVRLEYDIHGFIHGILISNWVKPGTTSRVTK